MKNIHLLDIPEFNEAQAAFTSYVINQEIGLKLPMIYFTPCEIKFGKMQVRYRLWLNDPKQKAVVEFFIVMNGDTPASLIQRRFSDDVLDEDSIGYITYSHKIGYHLDGLLDIIIAIPQQAPVIYEIPCTHENDKGKH